MFNCLVYFVIYNISVLLYQRSYLSSYTIQSLLVCWDNFDANEIWQAARERSSRNIGKQAAAVSGGGGSVRKELDNREDRRGSMSHSHHHDNNGGGGDTWRRGVALPPAGEVNNRRSNRYDDIADNPDDLWDDPSAPQMAAASDFSAFGGALDDEPLKAGSDAFDLAQMSKAAREFEEDLRGGSGASSVSDSDGNQNDQSVNATRPLASAGTTIRSGSGDDVNVFEDFGEPEKNGSVTNVDSNNTSPIKSGEKQSASSRLMQMIGVGGKNGSNEAKMNDEGEPQTADDPQKENIDNIVENANAESGAASLFSFSSGISKNPWGNPSASTPSAQEESSSFGLDLAAKLRDSQQQQQQVELQKESERLKMEEMERMRLREAEEEQRRVVLLAQQQQAQQAELRLRQQQAAAREQQQQQAQQQQQQQQAQQANAQIELILTDRIAAVLENSWGRSDLMSVLSTLHNEDSRVVPLLGTVDALRALIARHPRRFALMKDPSIGTEMAILIMNNVQWQQHKQAEDLQRRQQEEHRQKMLAAQQEAASRTEAEKSKPVITDSPWYYADPQGNVQVSRN